MYRSFDPEEGRITNSKVLVCNTPYSVTALQAADAPSLGLACGFDTSQVTTGRDKQVLPATSPNSF